MPVHIVSHGHRHAMSEACFSSGGLVPHRSLSRRGFHLLLGSLGTLSLTVGTIFWLAGAWPVIGFMGLDVLLLWVALRASYSQAKAYEQSG